MCLWHPPDDDAWWLVADPEFSLATVTWPVHDIDLGVIERGILLELTKSLTGGIVGDLGDAGASDRMLAAVLDAARRRGLPAVRAGFDEDGAFITIEMVMPKGVG